MSQNQAHDVLLRDLDNRIRNVFSIVENLEAVVDRQSGGISGGVAQVELIPIQLKIIDLQLRLTGDTIAANHDLELLLPGIGGSELEEIINLNRQRLARITPRNQIIGIIYELQFSTQEFIEVVETKIAADDVQASEGILRLLNNIVKVKRINLKLKTKLNLLYQLSDEIINLEPHLVLNNQNAYEQSIEIIQQLADQIRSEEQDANITNILNIISELKSTGFPENYLDLSTLSIN